VPTLNEVAGGNTGATQTLFTTNNVAVIEPLNGPTSVEEVMDRFPEETYQQGRDTHLFRLLTALCGDSGAGLAKKQAYAARLRYEAEFVEFDILSDVYVAQFQFQRLANETYGFDVNVDALTPTQWDQVQLADQSYYHRMQTWWQAVRYGNSGEGLRLAAEAGTGVDCDIVEHWRFIHDLYSDLKLGLKPSGFTNSNEEFVVIPRFVASKDEDVTYSTGTERLWTFTPVTLSGAARPVPAPGGVYDIVTRTYVPPVTRIDAVGASSRAGNTIPIPPHQAGDLIVITAMQFNPATPPGPPTPGGTVPAWVTEESALIYQLGVSTFSFVATAGTTSSGTFARTSYLTVAVFRPTNGTLSVGAKATTVLQGPGPFVVYPALALQNTDGTSGVYRMAAMRETGDTQIHVPPMGYTFLTQYGLRAPLLAPVDPSVSAGFATHFKASATSVTADSVRSTNSGGPGSEVVTSIELKMTPAAGVTVETTVQKAARYALEATQTVSKDPFLRLRPEYERNAVEMLDRLRPVTSVPSFKPEPSRYSVIDVDAAVAASSERLNVTRFVTGRADVPWPDVDPAKNFFIVGDQETEPGYFFGSNRDLPVVFLTTETLHAYRGDALADPTYGTNDFFATGATGAPAPFESFRSEHHGPFFPVVGAIFPFVLNALPSASFTADQAVASQDTPLVFEGQAVG